MTEEETSALASIRDCWIAGGSAIGLAPHAWKPAIVAAEAAEAERRLLAIAGQALRVALRPAAPKGLTARPALQHLALPFLPDPLRPLFRAAMDQTAPDLRYAQNLLSLVAARGYAAHPADWFPLAPNMAAPAIYGPWLDWTMGLRTGSDQSGHDLSPETWDEFVASERIHLLTTMRRTDPDEARAIIETKAPSVPAEQRLSLVEVLSEGLHAGDVPFLETLATDRSGKVRELADQLLARLEGSTSATDELRGSVAEFFTQGTAGLLRRRRYFAPTPVRNESRKTARYHLLRHWPLAAIAKVFDVTDAQFVTDWRFGDDEGFDRSLVRNIAEFGSDAAAAAIMDVIVSPDEELTRSLTQLASRLDRDRRQRLVLHVLDHNPGLADEIALMQPLEFGWVDAPRLRNCRSYWKLESLIERDGAHLRAAIDGWLFGIGLVLTPGAAAEILDDLARAGLRADDPLLALLRLNAALP
jgi:hypothetical protein